MRLLGTCIVLTFGIPRLWERLHSLNPKLWERLKGWIPSTKLGLWCNVKFKIWSSSLDNHNRYWCASMLVGDKCRSLMPHVVLKALLMIRDKDDRLSSTHILEDVLILPPVYVVTHLFLMGSNHSFWRMSHRDSLAFRYRIERKGSILREDSIFNVSISKPRTINDPMFFFL